MNRREHKSGRARALLLVSIAAALVGLTGAHVVWNPEEDAPDRVDAVVVLASGADRRAKGRQLVVAGVSDNLVLSVSKKLRKELQTGELNVVEPKESKAELLDSELEECGLTYGNYLTFCLYPRPNNTVGEAVALDSLARREGWESVLIVTERSHLFRARATFNRCTASDLQVYGLFTVWAVGFVVWVGWLWPFAWDDLGV